MRTLSGLAIMPRLSLNNTFYAPEELAKFNGVKVPLRFLTHKTGQIVGEATFYYDPRTQQVNYQAIVNDPIAEEFLQTNPNIHVSIGATVAKDSQLCNENGKCYYAPVIGQPTELAIVNNPGIPESTGTFETKVTSNIPMTVDVKALYVIESECPDCNGPCKDGCKCDKCGTQESDGCVSACLKNKAAMGKDPTDPQNQAICYSECKASENITSNNQSNEDKSMTNEASNTEAPKTEVVESAKTVEAPKVEESKSDVSQVVESVLQKIEASNERTIKAIVEESSKHWTPQSEVAESSATNIEKSFTDAEAKAFLDRVFENGYGRMVIDKEGWISTHKIASNGTHGDVQEAITTSGTIPGVVTSSDVSIQVGSKTVKPIRQYGQFQAIPTGQNTARFYRISVPDAGAITESPTTDITAATHTLTSVDVTCNIRGWRQTVKKQELENYPAAFLNALRETARLEAIRDEHKLIVQMLGSLSNDFGGTTTAPYHISGSDGTAVTTGTLEDATGEFDEDGITFAKRYLEQLGQDTSPGNLIAFISPRAFRSLITSSGLTNYTQIGFANVTQLGQLEQLFGVDIVVTNELKVNANSYRNIVAVKGKAWALASQREMEIELQKLIKGQYWDVVWTHRIGCDVIDPNTYVIVSSKQD